MRLDQTDDRFELLSSLSAAHELQAAQFMIEHKWCGQQFREAVKGIRKMRIALAIGDDGESIRIRKRHARRARAAAESYFARTYNL